LIEIRYQT